MAFCSAILIPKLSFLCLFNLSLSGSVFTSGSKPLYLSLLLLPLPVSIYHRHKHKQEWSTSLFAYNVLVVGVEFSDLADVHAKMTPGANLKGAELPLVPLHFHILRLQLYEYRPCNLLYVNVAE